MKKFLLVSLAASLAGATAASAAGIDLSWDDCGKLGHSTRSFACSSNVAPRFALVGSFVPPPDIGAFVGMTAQLSVTAGEVLPDWWQLGRGTCRGMAALVPSFDFSADTSCADLYMGQGVGTYGYEVGYLAPNRGRIVVECAVPYDSRAALDPATEYYAFRLLLSTAYSTGDSACAGCELPACIVLEQIQLYQPVEMGNNPILARPVERNWVTWQASEIPNCPAATRPPNLKWGVTKPIYH